MAVSVGQFSAQIRKRSEATFKKYTEEGYITEIVKYRRKEWSKYICL